MAEKAATGKSRTARKKRITVKYNTAEAKSIAVAGAFNNWQTDCDELEHDGHGVWQTKLTLPPGRYEYRFVVDGAWRDDPHCAERVPNEFGGENCVLRVE